MAGRRWRPWGLAVGVLLVGAAAWCCAGPAHTPVQQAALRPEPAPPEVREAPALGDTHVECELSEEVSEGVEVTVVEVDPDSLDPIATHVAAASDGWIRFRPHHAAGLGRVYVPRYQPATVAWVEGGCLSLVDLVRTPHREHRGRLSGLIETGAVSVTARCGGGDAVAWSMAVGTDGDFTLDVPTDRGACEVRVYRVFGGRDLFGPWLPLAEVLEVPVPPGVGMDLLEVDAGLRVVAVEPGLDATSAGLVVGDVVVAVDGEPAAELDTLALAESDGPMALEVLRDGEPRTVRIP